jgi:hypothetical protein
VKNIPTAYELGQQYAELQKAHSEALAVSTKAGELFLALDKAARGGGPQAFEMFIEAGKKAVAASDKTRALEAELAKVKKNAWKWYGVYL